MQGKRLVDAIGPGPDGIDLHFAAGTINDHPDVWILCVLPKPVCAPFDDECKAAVEKYLNQPERRAQLQRLKQLAQPATLAQLPPDLQEYIKAVSAKWGIGQQAKSPEPPADDIPDDDDIEVDPLHLFDDEEDDA